MQDVRGPLKWVDKDFLAEQRATHPDSVYRRLHLERMVRFRGPPDQPGQRQGLCAAHVDGPLDWAEGHRSALTLDLGVRHDRTVAALMRSERMTEPAGASIIQRYLLARMEVWAGTRTNPVDLGAVEQWVEYTTRAYRAKVVCDPWQAIAMVQRLRSRGLQVEEFTFSQQSVGRLAVGLHNVIRDHRLAIPNNPELVDELVNVRLRETAPNVYRLDHDPDRHDDRAVALAMGVTTLATVPPARRPS